CCLPDLIAFTSRKVHFLACNGVRIRRRDHRRRVFRRRDRAYAQTETARSARPCHRKNGRIRSQSRGIDYRSEQLLYDPNFGSDPLSRSSSARKTGFAPVVFESSGPVFRRLRRSWFTLSKSFARLSG